MNRTISPEHYAILEGIVEKYGSDVVLDEFFLNKKYIPYATAAALTLAGGASGKHFSAKDIEKNTEDEKKTEIQDERSTNPYGMTKSDYELFKKKVEAVRNEINRVMLINGKTLDDIKFDIEYMVYMCYKYNYDIPMMLSQAQWESTYGITNRAVKTGSIFSVGLWDNKTVTTYDNQNESIEGYIKLIQRDYLQNGKKTYDDLLKPGKFVNMDGHRYASNPKYEDNIRGTRNSIIRRIPILTQNYTGAGYGIGDTIYLS